MKINNRILNNWKLLRERGDLKRIQEEAGISRPTLLKALAGECSEETYLKIADFFNKRIQRIDQNTNEQIKSANLV